MEDNKHTQGEWSLNNPIDDDENIIIKRNPQYGDQKYFAICVKNSFNLVGFYYPSSKQSEPEMIANAKIICKAVNEYDTLVKERELLIEALNDIVDAQYNPAKSLNVLNNAVSEAKELLNNLQK